MADLASTVSAAWESYVELEEARAHSTDKRDYVYASGRRPCVRWLALDLIHPGEGEEWTNDARARVRRGKARERAMVADMLALGQLGRPRFDVEELQKRVEFRDRDGSVLIAGKMEGKLSFQLGADDMSAWYTQSGKPKRGQKVVFEIKSGLLVERARSLEDLDRNLWSKQYVDQVLFYALMEGVDALFIIDRPGLPVFIELPLEQHLNRAEGFLQDARAAVDARFGRAPLPEMTEDRTICQKCPHLGKSCHPPMDFGEGTFFTADEELVSAAADYLAYKEASTKYEHAKDQLAKRLRGAPTAIISGDISYLVQGKWQPNTTYPVPDSIKQQYKKVEKEGKWMQTLTPLGESGARD
jgi:hypothetical protein